jgi:acyl-CoA thioester hydrolase
MRSWPTCCYCSTSTVPDQPAAPYQRYQVTVGPEWIDYNGHLNDAGYAVLLSAANEVLLDDLGLSERYRRETGRALYTVASQIRYLAECKLGDVMVARSLLVSADAKRIRLHTELVRADEVVVATGEYLYLHVDEAAGGVTAMPPDRSAAVAALLAVQADLPRPDHIGRGIAG